MAVGYRSPTHEQSTARYAVTRFLARVTPATNRDRLIQARPQFDGATIHAVVPQRQGETPLHHPEEVGASEESECRGRGELSKIGEPGLRRACRLDMGREDHGGRIKWSWARAGLVDAISTMDLAAAQCTDPGST
jgi:hypothetical protein